MTAAAAELTSPLGIAVTGGGSRAIKYKHNLAIQFPLVPAELSVICLLLLRGPMTPGEINNNSGRLFEFESLEEVQETLSKLAGDETPYVRLLEKRPGQKEQRYAHLFGEAPEYVETAPAEKSSPELIQRVERLEEEVAYLRENLDKLMKELMG